MTEATANLYDFTDLTAIPSELADAVSKERSGLNPELYRAVVAAVSGAPVALTLKQVLVVLIKMGVELPAETTIRAYLNRAKDNGDIGKPSKQSYWTVDSNVDATEAEAAQEAVEAGFNGNDDEDILAGFDA